MVNKIINECEGGGGIALGDVAGMGDISFPSDTEAGSGDLALPSKHLYTQVMPYTLFKKSNKKRKRKLEKHSDAEHTPNAPVYDYVDDFRTYAKRTKPYLCEEVDIPIDSFMDISNGMYNGNKTYRQFNYIGDCRNTVDVDRMWDATQMSYWLSTIQIISINDVLYKLSNGDRKIPKIFFKKIEEKKKKGLLENMSEIVCGIDDYQKILAIYISDTDIHYFFECIQ